MTIHSKWTDQNQITFWMFVCNFLWSFSTEWRWFLHFDFNNKIASGKSETGDDNTMPQVFNSLFSNQLPYNKILTESMWGTCKIVNFSWLLLLTLMIGQDLLKQKTPFKNGVHFFWKLPLCRFMQHVNLLCKQSPLPAWINSSYFAG